MASGLSGPKIVLKEPVVQTKANNLISDLLITITIVHGQIRIFSKEHHRVHMYCTIRHRYALNGLTVDVNFCNYLHNRYQEL